MQPDVSVVIVTWNGRQHLDICLAAVAAQQGVATETIIVDNGSTDGTAELIRSGYPWVKLVALAENCGFAGGNNAGAREARGRFVAFLNNDTSPDPGWLRALLAGIDEPAGFALTTSRIVYMHDPDVIDSAGDGMLRWGGAYKRHHGEPTSMAEASVGMLARGCHCPFARKSGTARLALCASTMRPIGRPILRAQTQATELPRLPLGIRKLGATPCSRCTARLVAA